MTGGLGPRERVPLGFRVPHGETVLWQGSFASACDPVSARPRTRTLSSWERLHVSAGTCILMSALSRTIILAERPTTRPKKAHPPVDVQPPPTPTHTTIDIHRHHHRHNHVLAACTQHVLDTLPVAASGLLRHMLVLMGAAGPQCATGGRSAVAPGFIRLHVDGEQHSAHHFTPARRHLQREMPPIIPVHPVS
ncbi:hypothetical protein LA080_007263 [Diaporthe eres]|nr:hypothetical protein LA080_007263 [Diaporthe eres]